MPTLNTRQRAIRWLGPALTATFLIVAVSGGIPHAQPAPSTDPSEPLQQAISVLEQARDAARGDETQGELDTALDTVRGALDNTEQGNLEEAVSNVRVAMTWLRNTIQKADERGESGDYRAAAEAAATTLQGALVGLLREPTGFDVIVPTIAAEGDVVTGLVVADTPSGQPFAAAFEGEDVAVAYGQVAENVKVEQGGKITLPPFVKEAGRAALQFVLAREFQGKQPDPVTRPMAVVPQPPPEAHAEIAHTTPTLTSDGILAVTGQALGALTNPRYEAADGQVHPIADVSVGSSLQRFYPPVRGLPPGSYTFVADGPDGRRVAAPNQTTQADVSLSTEPVTKVGAKGAITVTSNADTWIQLLGGEPQVTPKQRYVEVTGGKPARVPFTANVVGPYAISALIVGEETANLASAQGEFTVELGEFQTEYDPGTNTTHVSAPVVDGPASRGTLVDGVICYPGGLAYANTPLARNGTGTMALSLPGNVPPGALDAYVLNAASPNYLWQPYSTVFPDILFGTAGLTGTIGKDGGGTSKDAPTGTAPDPGRITDIAKYVDDFNKATKHVAEFEVTLFVDQPGKGGDRDVIEDGDVGHTFIQIRGGGQSITVGFYPAEAFSRMNVVFDSDLESQHRKDDKHPWDVKKTWKVKPADVEKIKAQIKKWKGRKYNLRTANCTDFALDVLKAGGLNPPSGKKTKWPSPLDHVTSANPGDLGEDLMGKGQGGERKKSTATPSTGGH